MRRGECVGLICFLALGLSPVPAQAQTAGSGGPPAGQEQSFQLEQNYPNPFNPSTRIPFYLGELLFEAGNRVAVSMRIYNVLQQLVAIPVALDHAEGSGIPVDGLEYGSPGRKEAYWDGLDRNGREVASGIYYIQLVVNGESRVRKMVVAK